MKLPRLSFKSLKTRLLATAVVAVLGAVGIVFAGVHTVFVTSIEKLTETNLRATFESAKHNLQTLHDSRWSDIDWLANRVDELMAANNRSGDIANLLTASREHIKYFSEIAIADTEGTIMISTDSKRVGEKIKRTDALRAILTGSERYLDGPYWDDKTESLGATTSNFHDGITLMYAKPLSTKGKITGILLARMPNDVQADQIQREESHIYKGSGDTYMFMVKAASGSVNPGIALSRSRFEDSSVIAGPNLKEGVDTGKWGVVRVKSATELEMAFKDPATNDFTEGVSRIIRTGVSSDTTSIGYFDYRHIPVVGVGGTIQVPGSPDLWGLVVEADVAEAFAPVFEANQLALYLSMGCGAAAVLLLAWIVVKPMNELHKLAERIRETSKSVHNSSLSLGRSANSLSGSATDQAAAIAQTMASMEEITAMVTANNDSAGQVLALAQENSEHAQGGVTVVSDMGDAMNSIAEQNAELARVVEIIENISEKTKVINDIVFETKLLSFNASIEAARAGEQGKGFAVVAEEVGNLARLSGKAAQEISALIEQSTRQVQTMVTVTKESISEGIAVTERARTSFENIREGVKQVSEMMNSIALSSNEQKQGISQVAKAMGQMDSQTQNTAIAAGDAAKQSSALKQAGERLRVVVLNLDRLVGVQNSRIRARQVDESPSISDDDMMNMESAAPNSADIIEFPIEGADESQYDAEQAGMENTPKFDDVSFG